MESRTESRNRDLIIFATSNGTAAKRRASTKSSAFNPGMIIGLSALLIALLGLSLIPVGIHTAKAEAAVAYPSSGYIFTLFATGFPSSNNFCSFNGQGCGPLGLAFDASGNLFVVDINNGGLYKFPPTGGDASTHLVNTIPGNPTGLVFTKDWQLLTSRAADDDIVQLNLPSGGVGPTIAQLQTSTFEGFGLAIDPMSGDLFASSSGGGPIFRISTVTNPPGTVTTYSNIPQADGIAFDPTNGVLYAASNACGGVASITGTNSPTPGVYNCLASVPAPDGIAVSRKPGAPIIFVNRSDGVITRVDHPKSQPPGLTDIPIPPIPGGNRGDFATIGPDGCLYATQSDSVIKVTNADGKTCPFSGFLDLSDPNLLSCLSPCSSQPRTATVGSDVYAAWLNNTSGNSNLLFTASNNNGSSFGPTVKITNSTTENAANPQIAAVGSDVYLVWQQNISLTNNRILFRASVNNGASFGPVFDITSGSGLGSGTSKFPEVAAVGNSVYVVLLGCTDVTCDTRGNNLIETLFRASTDNGSTFAHSLVTLSTTTYAAAEPQIKAVASYVYATWSDVGSGRARTVFTVSSNGGNSFGPAFNMGPTPLGETDLYQEMAISGNSVYLAWTNETMSTGNTMFAASTNNGASFGVALNLNKAVVTDLRPKLAASGTNVYAVWSDASGGNTEVLYTASFNNGASFQTLQNLSNVPGTSNQQTIAASDSNVYTTWIESGTSNNGVYFASSSDSGSTFQTLFNLISDSVSIDPVVSGSGSYAYVAWEDGTTGNGDIYLVSGKPFAFDFSIANSGPITLTQGSSGSNDISVGLNSGTSQTVTLSCNSGLPSGASCTFNPISGTPGFSSIMTISTQPSTTLGSYNVTITGAAGDLGFGEVHSTHVRLIIKGVSVTTSVPFTSAGLRINLGGTVANQTSVYDTASITGATGTTPTGNVTYTFYTNGACSGSGKSQTVILSNGNVPNSVTTNPLLIGSYSFNATYNGDSNYLPSTGPCEFFTVASSPSVGGTVVPVDKLGLLFSYASLASLVLVAALISGFVYRRTRRTRPRDKEAVKPSIA